MIQKIFAICLINLDGGIHFTFPLNEKIKEDDSVIQINRFSKLFLFCLWKEIMKIWEDFVPREKGEKIALWGTN